MINNKFTFCLHFIYKGYFMKKIVLKTAAILSISGGILLSQYYDPYYYQNNYNNQQYNNNSTENNLSVNNYNYYEGFMKMLAAEANNPNSIYYNPSFFNQYNNAQVNNANPYEYVIDAMNFAYQNYNYNQNQNYSQNNNQNHYNTENYYNNNSYKYNNNQNNSQNYANPYKELMNMLERESKNPNSPYYSPNTENYNSGYYDNENNYAYYNDAANSYYNYNSQNYNGGYDGYYNNENDYAYYNNTANPYELAAEELIKAAEELTKKANHSKYNNIPEDNNAEKNNTSKNFYTPFKVPEKVFNTIREVYPNVEILDISMHNIGIYEVKLANTAVLHIDRKGKLLYKNAN